MAWIGIVILPYRHGSTKLLQGVLKKTELKNNIKQLISVGRPSRFTTGSKPR